MFATELRGRNIILEGNMALYAFVHLTNGDRRTVSVIVCRKKHEGNIKYTFTFKLEIQI